MSHTPALPFYFVPYPGAVEGAAWEASKKRGRAWDEGGREREGWERDDAAGEGGTDGQGWDWDRVKEWEMDRGRERDWDRGREWDREDRGRSDGRERGRARDGDEWGPWEQDRQHEWHLPCHHVPAWRPYPHPSQSAALAPRDPYLPRSIPDRLRSDSLPEEASPHRDRYVSRSRYDGDHLY